MMILSSVSFGDSYSAEVNTIVVDSSAGVKRVKQQLANWSSGRSPQGVFIDYHREATANFRLLSR